MQLRQQIIRKMGTDALIDTAAVAGLFNAIDRVANATGIPLEDAKAAASEQMRDDLGVNEFHSVVNHS